MSKLLALSGSLRKDSLNRKLLRVATEGARRAGAEVTEVDLNDFPLPLYHGDVESEGGLPANALRLLGLFKEHSGLLIASPEYNSGYPAVLKNTIDWVSRRQPGDPPLAAFAGKWAALLSASPGAFGGMRGLLQLRTVLSYLRVNVLGAQVALSAADKAFAEDGTLIDPRQAESVLGLGAELADVVRKLAPVPAQSATR